MRKGSELFIATIRDLQTADSVDIYERDLTVTNRLDTDGPLGAFDDKWVQELSVDASLLMASAARVCSTI